MEATQSSSEAADFGYYIALFNRDGTYDKSFKLPIPNFVPARFAILSSGEFLISGFDHANSRASLFILNASGAGMRPLQMPDAIGEPTAVDDPYSVQGVVASNNLLGSISMTSFRDKILVWRRDVKSPILEVGSGGTTREIPVESPQGYTLVAVVSSNSQLVVQYAPGGGNDVQTRETSNMSYYFASAADGQLTQKLKFVGDVPGSLACENDGVFTGYETDDKGKLWPLVGK